MKSSLRVTKLLQVIFLACAAYLLQACQEFIHDSFDTFQGVIVDESGNPVSDLRLTLYPSSSAFYSTPRQGSGASNRVITNSSGEFKVVFPSRNLNALYYLVPPTDLAFEVDQFGTLTKVRELLIEPTPTNRNRVTDLGRITVVAP
jgi:hypothetical protein